MRELKCRSDIKQGYCLPAMELIRKHFSGSAPRDKKKKKKKALLRICDHVPTHRVQGSKLQFRQIILKLVEGLLYPWNLTKTNINPL